MFNVPKYEIIIYWSKEDNCYIAEVPELSGCMADGKTLKEVTENVEQVMREWIECAIEDGEEIPVPKGKLMYA
ncbi:MAG: type II toxin-antitoxin system HicB family antitoxin [Oscillospiraceae bacterium]|jgi:predicted RNase H-like HicB family nuclease|nr:type II toxin-antitoxin system HicB family antitoxin [Oscillospiraceae bacterium]